MLCVDLLSNSNKQIITVIENKSDILQDALFSISTLPCIIACFPLGHVRVRRELGVSRSVMSASWALILFLDI